MYTTAEKLSILDSLMKKRKVEIAERVISLMEIAEKTHSLHVPSGPLPSGFEDVLPRIDYKDFDSWFESWKQNNPPGEGLKKSFTECMYDSIKRALSEYRFDLHNINLQTL